MSVNEIYLAGLGCGLSCACLCLVLAFNYGIVTRSLRDI